RSRVVRRAVLTGRRGVPYGPPCLHHPARVTAAFVRALDLGELPLRRRAGAAADVQVVVCRTRGIEFLLEGNAAAVGAVEFSLVADQEHRVRRQCPAFRRELEAKWWLRSPATHGWLVFGAPAEQPRH